MPKTEFVPFPAGQQEGIIYDVEDLGQELDPFAPPPPEGHAPATRHRVSIKIEALDKFMEDGQPFMINVRCNVSGHPKSNLRQFRESIAGRKLTEQEAYSFDDQEVIGVRVGFLCEHREGGNGATYANVKAVWRLPEERQHEGKIHNGRWGDSAETQQQPQQQQGGPQNHPDPPGPAPHVPGSGDDPLPF